VDAGPGAGAPKGNMNAFKHGRSSKQFERLIQLVAADPNAMDALRNLADGVAGREHRNRREADALLRKLMERIDEETRITAAYFRAKRRQLASDPNALSAFGLDYPLR
jgi:hypothetical protein